MSDSSLVVGSVGNLTCDRGFVYRLASKASSSSSEGGGGGSSPYQYEPRVPVRCFATAREFGDERDHVWKETRDATKLRPCVPGKGLF